MDGQHGDLITKMFEFNLYANATLIRLCAGLTTEQLAYETNGGFGATLPTLAHLVAAEGGYIKRLTGSRFLSEDFDEETVSIRSLLTYAEQTGQKLIDIAADTDINVSHTISFPDPGPNKGKPFTYYNWTVLIQALHHSGEHRTHVKVLLTHLGIQHPDLSAWTYMEMLHGFE